MSNSQTQTSSFGVGAFAGGSISLMGGFAGAVAGFIIDSKLGHPPTNFTRYGALVGAFVTSAVRASLSHDDVQRTTTQSDRDFSAGERFGSGAIAIATGTTAAVTAANKLLPQFF